MSLRRGEEVEVRSLSEIRATLDERGRLGGVPFMPEMERFAGRRARVWRRADRVCVEGAPTMRRLDGFVLLEDLRCDGAAHGGCQRACLLLWHETWLRRPGSGGSEPPLVPCTQGALSADVCQSTALLSASRPLSSWHPGQYLRDLATGNLTPAELFYSLFHTAAYHLTLLASSWRRALRPAHTPSESLGLAPGDWVEIKSLPEIEATLDGRQKNRGLEFSPGMSRYCGRRFRVAQRLERMILETTGELREVSDTVLLEGLNCDGACSRGCPRYNPLYWREIWLRRVPGPDPNTGAKPS